MGVQVDVRERGVTDKDPDFDTGCRRCSRGPDQDRKVGLMERIADGSVDRAALVAARL
jgi:hypothetical protein